MKYVEWESIPTSARPEQRIWDILVRESTRHDATLWQTDEGVYGVVWSAEERRFVPFSELVYDEQLGLYDRRHKDEIPMVGDRAYAVKGVLMRGVIGTVTEIEEGTWIITYDDGFSMGVDRDMLQKV